MEIILQLQNINKFSTVLIEQEPLHKLISLQNRSFLATLHHCGICEVRKRSTQLAGLLNILVNLHALKCTVEIKREKFGFCCPKILRIIHTVVLLVLVSVQVTDCPRDFKPSHTPLLEFCVLR